MVSSTHEHKSCQREKSVALNWTVPAVPTQCGHLLLQLVPLNFPNAVVQWWFSVCFGCCCHSVKSNKTVSLLWHQQGVFSLRNAAYWRIFPIGLWRRLHLTIPVDEHFVKLPLKITHITLFSILMIGLTFSGSPWPRLVSAVWFAV